MKVHVVTYELPYEPSVTIGVALTRDAAVSIATEHASKNGRTGNRIAAWQEFPDGMFGATTNDYGAGYFIGTWEVQE